MIIEDDGTFQHHGPRSDHVSQSVASSVDTFDANLIVIRMSLIPSSDAVRMGLRDISR